MAKILGFMAACLAAVVIGCSAAPEPKYTIDDYRQLQPGMSREQVEAILGTGTELSRVEVDEYSSYILSWDDEDAGVSIIVQFSEGKVFGFSQHGL